MDDYISREDAIDCIEHITWYHVNGRGQLVDGATSDTGLYKAKDVYEGLHSIPSADVVPVVHGQWKDNKNGTVSCSRCSTWFQKERVPYLRFCGYCGAKMDGERKE